MTWPAWIDELKDRYLADEGNVFVVHGSPVRPEAGAEDGVATLVRFQKRSREIVGVLRPAPLPSRLEFADISDRQRFENLVKAFDLLQGRALALSESDPFAALGRIWRALSTTGTAQAYLVTETERLAPGHRKRIEAIPGAPDLVDWPTSQVLTGSNNIVVFLCADPTKIRAELIERAAVIDAGAARPRATAAAAVAEPTDEAPAPTTAADREPPTADDGLPGVPPLPPDAAPGDLRADLEKALSTALANHPAAHRPAHIPVMAAVAAVVSARRPDRWGPLTFSLDAEGDVDITGEGASAFSDAWRGDVALDASASMLIKALDRSPNLDPTAVSALVRRIERLLRA